MNWIDYIIFGVLFFASILGVASGLLLQILRIVSLLIAFFTAFFFYSVLGNLLKGVFTASTANLVGYFVMFSVALVILYILTDILKRIIGAWSMGIGGRLFGGILGIFKGIIFCGVIIFGVLLFCNKSTCDTVNNSRVATQLARGMRTIVSVFPENISNKAKDYSEKINKSKKQKDEKPSVNNEDFKSSF